MYCLQRWHRYLPLSLAWNMLPLKVPSSLRCRAKISLVGKAVYHFGGTQTASVISSCHTSTWEIIWLANKDLGEILVQLQLTAHQPAAWMGSALLHPYGVLRRIWESPWRGDLQLKKKKKKSNKWHQASTAVLGELTPPVPGRRRAEGLPCSNPGQQMRQWFANKHTWGPAAYLTCPLNVELRI